MRSALGHRYAHRARRYVRAIVACAVLLLCLDSPAVGHPVDEHEHRWRVSGASFYGPGLYGNRMACGGRLTRSTVGVAHKTLPCGTHVRFEWHGYERVVQVIDRGPYVRGREWDLTAGLCYELTQRTGRERCNTGPIRSTL